MLIFELTVLLILMVGAFFIGGVALVLVLSITLAKFFLDLDDDNSNKSE